MHMNNRSHHAWMTSPLTAYAAEQAPSVAAAAAAGQYVPFSVPVVLPG